MGKSNRGVQLKPNNSCLGLFAEIEQNLLWEGKMWVNDGWGDKNFLLPYCTEFFDSSLNAREISANEVVIIPLGYEDEDTHKLVSPSDLEKELKFSMPNHPHYMIKMLGKNRSQFIDLLEKLIKQNTVKSVVVDLHSYLETELPTPGTPVYRMLINWTPNQSGLAIRIYQGEWLPSFEKDLLVTNNGQDIL